MADRARSDVNSTDSLLAVSNGDGSTIVTLYADPTTHALITSSSGGGGGGAVTIADGSDVAEGATTDAAVTAGSTGTISGKLRTVSADLSSIKANQTNATQKTQIVDGSGNVIASTSNALNVAVTSSSGTTGVVSTNNSTAATLTSGSVFTGTADDVLVYAEIRVSVFTNVASATDGLSFQQSSDNSNWDVIDTYTMPAMTAGQGKTYVVPRQERYFRVVYTNGGTGQTTFRMQTILNRQGTAPSSQRPGDAYTNETDLVQGQSFTMGFNGTTWDRLRTTGTGILTVSAAQSTPAAVTAGWPFINGELGDVTGTFTNATQTTNISTAGSFGSIDGYDTITLSINGTYGTATAVFEGSDDGGTTWYSIQGARSDSAVVETGYTSLTNTNRVWFISTQGFDAVRVRSTAVASGTANIRMSVSSSPTVSSTTAQLAAGTSIIGALSANQSVNVAQVNGVTVTMGNGVAGTGVQRVAIASDNTAFSVNAVQSGTWNVATVTTVTTLTGTTTLTPGTGATNLGKAEDAAHTTGDVGVMALGVRNDTLASTTNASADYTQLSTDTAGVVMVAGAPRLLKGTFQVQISASTAETTILAATASTFHDLYGLILANTGATTTKVSIRDTTAGTVRMIIEVPTLETRGFMLPVDSAIAQAGVNTIWTAQCGSSTTALEVTGLYVSRV